MLTANCQVASASFSAQGGGESVKVDFWLSGDGFSKTTSLCPCSVWMVKAGYDAKKALFDVGMENSMVEWPDACDA